MFEAVVFFKICGEEFGAQFFGLSTLLEACGNVLADFVDDIGFFMGADCESGGEDVKFRD